MGEASFTPGPWRLLDSPGVYALDENNEVNRFSARIDGGYTIYTRRQRDAGLNATSQEELAANARLIAAAPDLYEALTALLAGNDEFARQRPYNEEGRALTDAARAALAKANGETAA